MDLKTNGGRDPGRPLKILAFVGSPRNEDSWTWQIMTRSQPGSINHAYWTDRGWFDTEYYTQAPINPWARLMAGHIARKMRRGIRKGNAKPCR